MKTKLKRRLKLIKLGIFGFGFLVFIALFMGLTGTDRVRKKSVEEKEAEKVSAIIPQSFELKGEDYKIVRAYPTVNSESFESISDQEDNINLGTNRNENLYFDETTQHRNSQLQESVDIPKDFQSDGDTLYGREENKSYGYDYDLNYSNPWIGH